VRTFRVFLSSTFNDFQLEREAFRQRVVPELRNLCRRNGADFQSVDLRWSISEEAGQGQRTMQICLAEVRRCLSVTPRPNFVLLLGDRYGWRPVPSEIPASVFERLLHGSDAARQLLPRWYVCDENGDPPAYYLRPREGEYRARDQWRTVEGNLVQVLEESSAALGLGDSQRVMFGGSATEQEIQYGALSSDPTGRVFCFFRNIRGTVPDSVAAQYFDYLGSNPDMESRARLQKLKERLRNALGPAIREYEPEWRDEGLTSDHVEVFCRDVQSGLQKVIESEIADPAFKDELRRERREHAFFAEGRTRLFVGRRDLLDAVKFHTGSNSRSVFAVIGASGTGKSALIAKAAEEAIKDHTDSVIVWRFAGVTPQSSDTTSLLRSLCQEVSRAYSRDESNVPHTYDELASEFRRRLGFAHAGKPMIVFVDALDQLSDVTVRSSFAWIPLELPPYARLFVSALPELREAIERVIPTIVLLPQLKAEECDDILRELLSDAGRGLQPTQKSFVHERCLGSPIPLYLRLLFEKVRRWRSTRTSMSAGSDIRSILDDLIEDLSQPENHGEKLVSETVRLMAAARHGLTEDELIDNLSTDQGVMEEFRKRSRPSRDSQTLPPIVWSRLQADLEPYLTSRGADGASLLAFFHSQVRDYVVERFLVSSKKQSSRHLAAYFASQPLYLDKENQLPNLRKLAELPFQLVGGELREEAQALLLNFEFLERKIRSVGPQEVLQDFERVLSSGCCTNSAVLEKVRDAIRSRAHVLRGDPEQLPAQLAGCLGDAPESEIVQLLVDARKQTVRVWLRPITPSLGAAGDAQIRVLGGHQAVVNCVSVSASGRYAASGGNENVCVIWDLEESAELHRLTHEAPVFGAMITPDDRRVVCAAGSTLVLWDLMRGIRLKALQPEAGWIRALSLSRDGRLAIFGSDNGVIGTWDLVSGAFTRIIQTSPVKCLVHCTDDETIVAGCGEPLGKAHRSGIMEVWNIRTRELIRKFGDRNEIKTIALAPNGRSVIAGTFWGEVQFWNLEQGSREKTYQYGRWWADGVSITSDGHYVACGGVERCIRIWDTTNDELYATLKGHHNVVTTTAVLPDGKRLLSGSQDQSVRMWDLQRAKKVHGAPAHEGKIFAMCQSPDGQWIVSVSADRDIKFWDFESGRHSHTLQGHTAEIWSVAFTPDGTTLLTLQNGSQMIVWDVATRKKRRDLNLVPRAAAFSNRVVPCMDNRHFFCGGEMFEIETGTVVYTLPQYETGLLTVMPDDDLVLFHGNGTALQVWSRSKDTVVATLDKYGSQVALYDSNRLVTGGYELVVWDLHTWDRIRTIATGHRGRVNGLAACGAAGLIATVSGDHDAKIWSGEKGEHLATFTAEAPLSCCCLSGNANSVLAVGDEIGNLHFLRIEGFGSEPSVGHW
jgi:WD40 repeat protein